MSEHLNGVKTQKTICQKQIYSNVSGLFLFYVFMYFLILVFAEEVKTC